MEGCMKLVHDRNKCSCRHKLVIPTTGNSSLRPTWAKLVRSYLKSNIKTKGLVCSSSILAKCQALGSIPDNTLTQRKKIKKIQNNALKAFLVIF
jgi:hypothetical protein